MTAIQPRVSFLPDLHYSDEEKFAHPECQVEANARSKYNALFVQQYYRPDEDYLLLEQDASTVLTSCHELPGLDPAKYAVRGWDDPAAVAKSAPLAAIQKVGLRIFNSVFNAEQNDIEELRAFNERNEDTANSIQAFNQLHNDFDEKYPSYAEMMKTVRYFRKFSLPFARRKYIVDTWHERQEGLKEQILTYAPKSLSNHVFVSLGRLHLDGFDYQGKHYPGLPLGEMGIPYQIIDYQTPRTPQEAG